MGQAHGMAMRGLRPIAEIQYLDYLLYGLQTLSDDVATIHYRSKEELDSLELYPFKELIDRGLSSIMVAHLFVPAYDSSKNSLPYFFLYDLIDESATCRIRSFLSLEASLRKSLLNARIAATHTCE